MASFILSRSQPKSEEKTVNTEATNQNSVKNIGDILVVGDWFVDEYWFVVRHHSEISSHIKPYHYRIFTDAKHIVRDLCGGGFITRVLYELREYEVKNLSDTIKKIELAHEFACEFSQKIIPRLKEASDSTLKDELELFIKNKGKIKELKENNRNLDKNCCNLQVMSLLNETIKKLNEFNKLKGKLKNEKNELIDDPNYINDLINQLKNKYQLSTP